jgi:hypothetical protein
MVIFLKTCPCMGAAHQNCCSNLNVYYMITAFVCGYERNLEPSCVATSEILKISNEIIKMTDEISRMSNEIKKWPTKSQQCLMK